MGMMTLATGILLFSTMAYHYSRSKEAEFFNAAYRQNNQISISSILNIKEKEIGKTASDYAVWNEMTWFVKSVDKTWAKENIEAMLYTLDISITNVYSPDSKAVRLIYPCRM
jgi:sensor domain CHASE-containing protein